MDAHLQPVSWDWIKAVVVSTFVILMITSGIMMPLERFLEPRKLDRSPAWSRWLLVLPTAFVSGFVAEIVPRMLFALLEISVNHELLFRPGFDFLIWQLWAPLLFVAGGVQMAPKLKLGAFIGCWRLEDWSCDNKFRSGFVVRSRRRTLERCGPHNQFSGVVERHRVHPLHRLSQYPWLHFGKASDAETLSTVRHGSSGRNPPCEGRIIFS